jgi:CHAT domain-containing protein
VRFDADADAGEGLLAYARAAARPASEDGFLDALGPLPATRDECLAVRDSFKRRYSQGNVVFLREAQPTEEAVRREVPASRYLHLATHGYFAPPQLRSALAASSRGEFEESFGRFDRHDLSGFHPGLLSGVVLAGAQSPLDPARDDGILTALEVGYLDLRNVELATLSACETGLGETAGGEGLLGLQRAFQVAGCKSVVASLWKVHDEVTQKLMISFYDNLWGKGLTKVEALRQAQLAMLNRQTQLAMLDEAGERGTGLVLGQEPEGEHRLPPYYWAGFVLSGDWD